MTITAAKPGEQSATPVIPKIISVDDHVVEPAHTWERWLPAKYRDPRTSGLDVEVAPDWNDYSFDLR